MLFSARQVPPVKPGRPAFRVYKRSCNMETTNNNRSGGPRTEEGKARTRFNAVKHGLRSKSVLLPGENPEEYYDLKARMQAEWKPQGTTEEFQVEQMLQNQWPSAALPTWSRTSSSRPSTVRLA